MITDDDKNELDELLEDDIHYPMKPSSDKPRPLTVLLALDTYQGMSDAEISRIITAREIAASRKAVGRYKAKEGEYMRMQVQEKQRAKYLDYVQLLNERKRKVNHEIAAERRRLRLENQGLSTEEIDAMIEEK